MGVSPRGARADRSRQSLLWAVEARSDAVDATGAAASRAASGEEASEELLGHRKRFELIHLLAPLAFLTLFALLPFVVLGLLFRRSDEVSEALWNELAAHL